MPIASREQNEPCQSTPKSLTGMVGSKACFQSGISLRMRPRSMSFRRILYLLWFVVSTTLLLSAPGFGAAHLTPRASSALLQCDSPCGLAGAHSSRKRFNPNPEWQVRTSNVGSIPHRRVHRRFGIESPAAPSDPLFLQIANLFDTNLQVRSYTRLQSNGRSPPNPSV